MMVREPTLQQLPQKEGKWPLSSQTGPRGPKGAPWLVASQLAEVLKTWQGATLARVPQRSLNQSSCPPKLQHK